MKFFAALALVLLTSFSVFAWDETVRSYGNASGWCDGRNARWCMSDIVRWAERYAIDAADRYCWRNGGRLLHYTARCYNYCSPGHIPPGYQAHVSCRADCDTICQIRR